MWEVILNALDSGWQLFSPCDFSSQPSFHMMIEFVSCSNEAYRVSGA